MDQKGKAEGRILTSDELDAVIDAADAFLANTKAQVGTLDVRVQYLKILAALPKLRALADLQRRREDGEPDAGDL